jgi:hypothetical protein
MASKEVVAAKGQDAVIGIRPKPVGSLVGTTTYMEVNGYSEGANLSWDRTVETQESYGSDGIVVGGGAEVSFEATVFVIQDPGMIGGTATITPGTGYTSAPTVSFAAPPVVTGNRTATGEAIINSAGQLTGIFISDHGRGYVSAPAITITGGGGTGAAATAFLGGMSDVNLYAYAFAGDMEVQFSPAGKAAKQSRYTFNITIESGSIEPAVNGVISIPLSGKCGAVTADRWP